MFRDEGLHRSFYLCILPKPAFSTECQLQCPRPIEHYEVSPLFAPPHHSLGKFGNTRTMYDAPRCRISHKNVPKIKPFQGLDSRFTVKQLPGAKRRGEKERRADVKEADREQCPCYSMWRYAFGEDGQGENNESTKQCAWRYRCRSTEACRGVAFSRPGSRRNQSVKTMVVVSYESFPIDGRESSFSVCYSKVQVFRSEETDLVVAISSICTMMVEPPSTHNFSSLNSLSEPDAPTCLRG